MTIIVKKDVVLDPQHMTSEYEKHLLKSLKESLEVPKYFRAYGYVLNVNKIISHSNYISPVQGLPVFKVTAELSNLKPAVKDRYEAKILEFYPQSIITRVYNRFNVFINGENLDEQKYDYVGKCYGESGIGDNVLVELMDIECEEQEIKCLGKVIS